MSDDDVSLGVLLFIAARAIEMRVVGAARQNGAVDVTLAQGRIGARIAPQGSRLSDLAEQAQVSRQTATHLVDQLEKSGYVERTVDPSDGRARLVRFTAKGMEMVQAAREAEDAVYAEWEGRLGKRKMTQLKAILTELRPIMDPYL